MSPRGGGPGALPDGFEAHRAGRGWLVARPKRMAELVAAGMDRPRGWERRLERGAEGPGRGRTAVLSSGKGPALLIKRMRRGGLAGFLWRDRFVGPGRLLANIENPLEATRRGIATAAPAALLAVPGPPGFWRGWFATEEIPGATDMLTRLARSPAPGEAALRPVLRLVRAMHDAGLHHPDLNVGNLLVRETERGVEAFVVDLDRVAFRDASLNFRLRQAALRRMERSYVKRFGTEGPLGAEGRGLWYRLYAGEDRELARRLERGRRAGDILLRLHRLGWKR